MRILVLCDQGNNRSVTIAHHLKYWGHDVLSAGISTNTIDTLAVLCKWADRIILTARDQMIPLGIDEEAEFMAKTMPKIQLWDVGPDTYPRPFNPELLQKVRRLMEQHKAEYKS